MEINASFIFSWMIENVANAMLYYLLEFAFMRVIMSVDTICIRIALFVETIDQ